MKKEFPFYKQTEPKDSGLTCIKIIAKHYGMIINIQRLRMLREIIKVENTMLGLSKATEKIGFRALTIQLPYNNLQHTPLPCIAHWNKEYFVVVYQTNKEEVSLSDPIHGLMTYSKKEFINFWIGNNADETTPEGIVLILELN